MPTPFYQPDPDLTLTSAVPYSSAKSIAQPLAGAAISLSVTADEQWIDTIVGGSTGVNHLLSMR